VRRDTDVADAFRLGTPMDRRAASNDGETLRA
jgi:hypothetical protein